MKRAFVTARKLWIETKPKLEALSLVIGALLFGSGFDNVDCMLNMPWNGSDVTWNFGMIVFSRWWGYFLFGVVPMTVGLLMVGFMAGLLWTRKG